jgi:hypothetical protein
MPATMLIGFTLYDALTGAPLGGAAPVFTTYAYETGVPLAAPAIAAIAGGGYEFNAVLDATRSIYYEIDGGAAASPRYQSGVLPPSSGAITLVGFTLYDALGASPLAGAAPAFIEYSDETGAPLARPPLHAIAGGGYGFTPLVDPVHSIYYEIDGGAAANPRYLAGVIEAGSGGVVPPTPIPPPPFVGLVSPSVVDYVASWSDRLLSRLYVQFKDEPTWQLWCTDVLGPQFQDLEDAAHTLLLFFAIDDVSGVVLDWIGNIVGQKRGGVDDPTYRLYLKARIVANHSDGSPPMLYRVFGALFPSNGLRITTSPIKSFVLLIASAITPAAAQVGVVFLGDAKDAGARGILEWQEDVDAEMFTCANAVHLTVAAAPGDTILAVNDSTKLPASGSLTFDPSLATEETVTFDVTGPTSITVAPLASAHGIGAAAELVGDDGLGFSDDAGVTGGKLEGAAQAA